VLEGFAYALAALPVGSAASLVFGRPRRWARGQLTRTWAAVSPRQHEQDRQETAQLAARVAELTEQRAEDLVLIGRQAAQLEELRAWREGADRARARVATELARQYCDHEGNPDDEYRTDHEAWFRGDAGADVDYSRKQARDLARLAAGEFRRH
jgi:hypothetical protein